jgi:hypothetical protein
MAYLEPLKRFLQFDKAKEKKAKSRLFIFRYRKNLVDWKRLRKLTLRGFFVSPWRDLSLPGKLVLWN